jgi:hypothetical protein
VSTIEENDSPEQVGLLPPLERPAPQAPTLCVLCSKRPATRTGGVCARCDTVGWAT